MGTRTYDPAAAIPAPKSLPVSFVKTKPVEFADAADPRNANWEEFVARCWAAHYTPTCPPLRSADRWGRLLPPNTFWVQRSLCRNNQKLSSKQLLLLINGKLRYKMRQVVELHKHLCSSYARESAGASGCSVLSASTYAAA